MHLVVFLDDPDAATLDAAACVCHGENEKFNGSLVFSLSGAIDQSGSRGDAPAAAETVDLLSAYSPDQGAPPF